VRLVAVDAAVNVAAARDHITPVLAIGGDGEGRRRGELPNGGPTTA